MNMIKTTIALGALFSASVLFAQAPDANQSPVSNAPQAAQTQRSNFHRNFDPSEQAVHLSKRLGFSDDQMIQIGLAEITPILTDRQQEMQALRAETSLSKHDRHGKAQAIVQDSNSKIEAVLSDTQKQQFEQMIAYRNSHRRNRQDQPQA
jgi:periplasmic protein CpxP/Spy